MHPHFVRVPNPVASNTALTNIQALPADYVQMLNRNQPEGPINSTAVGYVPGSNPFISPMVLTAPMAKSDT